MVRGVTPVASLLLLLAALPGCRVIGAIFKAGMWTAFLIVGAVALLGIGLTGFFRRR